jgi:hypothetical protein
MRISLLPALLLAACGDAKIDFGEDTAGADTAEPDGGADDGGTDDGGTDDGSDDGSGDDTGDTGAGEGVLSLSLDTPALDPTLDGAPQVAVTVALEGADCQVSLYAEPDGGGVIALAVDWSMGAGDAEVVAWEGLDSGGAPVAPGEVALTAAASCDGGAALEASARLWIVPLTPASVDFTGPAEGEGGHVPLAFHKLDDVVAGVTVITPDIPELYAPGGELAPPWEEPFYPPWGEGEPGEAAHNLPAGYVVGALPRLKITPGELPGEGLEVRLVEGDLAPDGDGVLRPGEALEADLAEALPYTLGRLDLALEWRFEARSGGGEWAEVPGWLATDHRLYLLADTPVLEDGSDAGGSPPVPWIAVLDAVDADVVGLEADPWAVLDALRDFVNHHPDFVYNPSDRSYSEYEGTYAYWDRIGFSMTRWLENLDGTDMYCHSTSCLLSVLAGTLGVDAPQHVLGHNFTTNLLLPAGGDWSSYSFYSHSVVSPDSGATIWDAAVDLDGDGAPWEWPVKAVAVKGLPAEEYLEGLTRNEIGVVHTSYCYMY